MKKLIICIIFLLTMILLPNSVHAGNMDSYIDWELDRSIFAHKHKDGKEQINNLAMMTANGKVAYCIEPGVTAAKGSYYSSTTDIHNTNLGWVNPKRISLIGYYGYKYPGHNEKEYYMAAQELIWREMGADNVWWTDAKVGGNNLNIDYYKNEILRLVDNYEVAPTFNFKKKYMVGDNFSISDNNGVLEGYEVINSESVSINGNSLNVNIKDENTFTLRRKQNGKNAIFYYKDGYQTIGTFEFPYNYEKSYSIDSFYGKIIIDKMDFDNKNKQPVVSKASLEGAEYGLYDKNGKLLQKKKTDENGMIEFNNLKKDNYTIKEITPSKGYTLDKWTTKTFVGTGTPEVVVKSYEKIIENKIIITKVLDDKENGLMVPEEKIEFGLYDEDDTLIDTYVTNKDGVIEFTVPYGKYILKQLTNIEGISVAEDKVIEVIKSNENQNITIINHRIKRPPEETKEEPPEEFMEELPNTGKDYNLFYLSPFLLLITFYYYEKKNI